MPKLYIVHVKSHDFETYEAFDDIASAKVYVTANLYYRDTLIEIRCADWDSLTDPGDPIGKAQASGGVLSALAEGER